MQSQVPEAGPAGRAEVAAAVRGNTEFRARAPPSFRADHPFILLIREAKTGSILFLGRVVDPTATGV